MNRREIGIVAATFLAQAAAIGATIGAFSLFVRPLAEDFEATTLTITTGLALITFTLAGCGIFVGSWLDRGEPRRIMWVGSTIVVIGLVLASQATELWQLGLLCVWVGTGIPMLGPLTTAAVIGKAFDENRGRALGIASMGLSFGGLAYAFLATAVLEVSDWRSAYLGFAFFTALITYPVIAWGIPGDLGQASRAATASDHGDEGGWTPAMLIGSKAFILAALVFGIGAGTVAGWSPHMASYLEDLGASTRQQGLVVGLTQGLAVIGTLGAGFLLDRRGSTSLLIGILVICTACFGGLLLGPPLPLVFVLMLGFGIANGGLFPTFSHLIAERFGTASVGRAMGLSNLFMLPFGFGLPLAGGALRDLQGNYSGTIALCLALLAAGLVAAVLSGRVPVVAKVEETASAA